MNKEIITASALLAILQQALVCPKGRTVIRKGPEGGEDTSFQYRRFEDCLAAARPLLGEHGAALVFDSRLSASGTAVEATATLRDASGGTVSATAVALIETREGASLPQATGAAMSYAQKYAFANLFALRSNLPDADELGAPGSVQKVLDPKDVTPAPAAQQQQPAPAAPAAQEQQQPAETPAPGAPKAKKVLSPALGAIWRQKVAKICSSAPMTREQWAEWIRRGWEISDEDLDRLLAGRQLTEAEKQAASGEGDDNGLGSD